MNDGIAVRPAKAGEEAAIGALINAIQRQEFGISITLEDQPDLADIAGFYRQGAGDFWVATHGGRIVGTIAAGRKESPGTFSTSSWAMPRPGGYC